MDVAFVCSRKPTFELRCQHWQCRGATALAFSFCSKSKLSVDAIIVLLYIVSDVSMSRAGGRENTKRRDSMCPILQRVSFQSRTPKKEIPKR